VFENGVSRSHFCDWIHPHTSFVVAFPLQTKCSARRSGLGCGFWLIVMGIFSKFAGVITSIPDAVIGGMTIFLFANVFASGVTIASTLDLHSRRIK
jgi:NCS2 family nucleobase:cation symporter-2